MEENQLKQHELASKLHDCINKMLIANGTKLKKVVSYHSAATYIETEHGGFMIKMESYTPPKVVLDGF